MKNFNFPEIKLKPGNNRRIKQGCPWAFSNEIEITPETKQIPSGSIVCLKDSCDKFVGLGSFNVHSLISFRKFASDIQTEINTDFFIKRIKRAVTLRDLTINSPFYRLIHSEADGLPGLIVDRFDDIIACQINTAGMDNLKNEIISALDQVLSPKCIVLRSENSARSLEDLEPLFEVVKGNLPEVVPVCENGIYFYADLKDGQKTGWFYDQRNNRAFIGRLASKRRCIDFYTYAGGFALHMGIGHATHVIGVDRSDIALNLAQKAALKNNLAETTSWIKDNAFDVLEEMNQDKEKFGIVVCDPPAFAKNKKDIAAGLRGYRKMSKLAAGIVEKDGFLALGSCSHHVNPEQFLNECTKGIFEAGKTGRLIYQAGAGPDHPIHPQLPETAYLKMLVFQLD
ncbi:MAG: class I SAM-dependent rRNA methyltransferase [Alphaproteobacteria bacterium]|nr:class I SAM-dependent rRNA methyltransferase [Alphaproteobacteria bacterium]